MNKYCYPAQLKSTKQHKKQIKMLKVLSTRSDLVYLKSIKQNNCGK